MEHGVFELMLDHETIKTPDIYWARKSTQLEPLNFNHEPLVDSTLIAGASLSHFGPYLKESKLHCLPNFIISNSKN